METDDAGLPATGHTGTRRPDTGHTATGRTDTGRPDTRCSYTGRVDTVPTCRPADEPAALPHVRLANDVAVQFGHRPAEDAAAGVATHLRMFWDPRMRRALVAHVEAGGTGLEPVAVRAATLLRYRA